jgi:glycosyltransferase involved in cell wall biosynthesis
MSRLRIGIDYTSAFHQTAGIGRRTREMVRALADLKAGHNYRLFVQEARRDDLPPSPGDGFTWHPTRISELSIARMWQRVRLPLPLVTWWTGPLDLYHSPDFVLPPLPPGLPGLLTVHDLSFVRTPEVTMPGMHRYLGQGVPRSVARARHVIAVSECTKNDLIELYGTPSDKASVIYGGVQAEFQPVEDKEQKDAVRRRYGLGKEPFILTVGTLQPRKNHLRLVQAFARLKTDHRLVIAGGAGWEYEAVPAEVVRLGLEQRVLFPGFVSDADLPALYSAADLFAYPSLYEGFGLPLLEAMACGTPVVAADASSLPEVVGEAGTLADPLNVDALAGAMQRMLDDEALRKSKIQEGRARAATFTWERAGGQLLALYERVASGI